MIWDRMVLQEAGQRMLWLGTRSNQEHQLPFEPSCRTDPLPKKYEQMWLILMPYVGMEKMILPVAQSSQLADATFGDREPITTSWTSLSSLSGDGVTTMAKQVPSQTSAFKNSKSNRSSALLICIMRIAWHICEFFLSRCFGSNELIYYINP